MQQSNQQSNQLNQPPKQIPNWLTPLNSLDLWYLLIELKKIRDKIIISRFSNRKYTESLQSFNHEINDLIGEISYVLQ